MRTVELPPKLNGEPPILPDDTRRVIIIGANGAGKTRFAATLMAGCPPGRAFAISPLRALYGRYEPEASPYGIDALYAAALARSPLVSSLPVSAVPATEAERLMALLLQEEMVRLLDCKLSGQCHNDETKLDRALRLWRDIFPDNDIMRHNGALLFTNRRNGDEAGRPQHKLSAGETLALYYFGAVLFAPKNAIIMVDSPEMFLHPSSIRAIWDKVEGARPDCTFIYTTHDIDFAATRTQAVTIWVRAFHADSGLFDYDLLPPDSQLSEELYLSILGARRPVLFIEGDNTHSIDSKLYPLIFPEYTVMALGSCDRVIESTRVFNSLGSFHHLDSIGIVDRDRRSPAEVAYLRRKKVMVPEVAEIENMMMLEEVIRTVAASNGRDEHRAFEKVRSAVIGLFNAESRQQALQHTRHYVKRTIEHRIDGRFASITKLEEHIADLVNEVNPRAIYEQFCRDFRQYARTGDYEAILRVYNQKSMIAQSNVGPLTGAGDHRAYISAVLNILKTETPAARRIRAALRAVLR